MSGTVDMPALGESVTEGTVTRWLKAVGDTIEVDEPLLEVSTDKVDTEIPSPVAGVLQEILVAEDETVEVGARLAVIGDGSSGGGDAPAADDKDAETGDVEDAGPTDPGDSDDSAMDTETPEPSTDTEPGQEKKADGSTQEEAPDEPAQAAPAASGGGSSGGSSGGGTGTPVLMPALGESVTEGTVTRWLKAEGDTVEVDEPLLEVSTDKVDTEIPSPVAGTVQKLLVGEDETVQVGAELAIIGDGAAAGGGDAAPEHAAAPEPAAEAKPAAAPKSDPEPEAEPASEPSSQETAEQPAASQQPVDPQANDAPAQPDEPQQPPAQKQGGAAAAQPAAQGGSASGDPSGDASPYVTPLVRKLASQHGVELSGLTGTGVGGRIRKQDVLDAAEAAKQAAAAPAPAAPAAAAPEAAPASGRAPATIASVSAKRGTTEKMSRLRKLIAARMVESLQTSAQLTTVVEVDVTRVARLRDRAKADFQTREGVKLSFLPFFALAAVEALKAFPTVNASIEGGDTVVYHPQENLGIAVDTPKGLIVPVIREAGDLNIAGLSRKIADLAERTRTNKIGPDELGGGTFTLTNTGSRGALFDTPIINQPQVAILGTGAVVRRAVVAPDADGAESIAIRSMVYLALSYDHRIVDGADAARFLVTMKARLEEGAFEADLGL